MTPTQKRERIRRLNDEARTAFGILCRVVQTPGISALAPEIQSRIREQVETFDAFTKGNDPHGEHDFGAFEVEGAGRIFWKMDYYDRNFEYGSEDPADVTQTRRLLTIMLAEEY
jgi:hypothetical protein